jgi:predicted nucleic acid-binding protein
MKLVIDTSVMIDHLRGHAQAVAVLSDAARAGDELWSVTATRTEVLAGMRRGEERATHALLDAIRWQDVTCEIADRAGHFARRYLRSHPGVDTVDYLVAAASEVLGARVLTQNVRHFPMLQALRSAY